MEFIQKHLAQPSRLRILIAIAVLLHGLVLFAAWRSGSYLSDDSLQYFAIAENLQDAGILSQSLLPPPAADAQRVPGYGIFILLMGKIPFIILLVQHLLTFVSAWLIYKTLRLECSAQTASFLGILYLFEPYAFVFDSLIMAETLFITFLLAAVYHLWRMHKMMIWSDGLRAAIFIAIAAWIKPVAFPYLLIFMLFMMIRPFLTSTKKPAISAFALMIPLLMMPWFMIRSHQGLEGWMPEVGQVGTLYGRMGGLAAWQMDEQQTDAVLFLTGDSVAVAETGLPLDRLKSHHLRHPTQENELYTPEFQAIANDYMASHFGDAVVFHLRNIARMMAGYAGGWSRQVFGDGWAAYAAVGLQILFNIILIGGWLWSFLKIRKWSAMHWILLAIIGLTIAASSASWADGRYRMILDPLLLLYLPYILPKTRN